MKKQLLIMFVVFSLLVGPVFSSSNEIYEPTWQSKYYLFIQDLSHTTFTTYGEHLGCATHPDKQYFFDNSESKTYTLKCNNPNSLVNLYYIETVNNKLSYVGEREAGDTYRFLALTRYSKVMYECYPCDSVDMSKTPDGYEHGDKVCDHGDSISRIVFNNPDDYSDGYHYEELFECKSGTSCESDLDNCINSVSDYVRETASGMTSSDPIKDVEEDITITSDETKNMYVQFIEDSRGKEVNVEDMNSLLDESTLSEKEVFAVERIQELDKDLMDTQKATTSFPISLLIILFCILVLIVYFIVRVKK